MKIRRLKIYSEKLMGKKDILKDIDAEFMLAVFNIPKFEFSLLKLQNSRNLIKKLPLFCKNVIVIPSSTI